MSTSYYWHPTPEGCASCRRPYEVLEIGTEAGGWEFTFRGYPSEGLTTAKAWRERIADTSLGYVKDEYGRVVSPDEMAEVIRREQGNAKNHAKLYPGVGVYVDGEGYAFISMGWGGA